MKTPLLKDRCIAISISNSPDMAARGLGKEHLEDAMSEIARHLIASGGTVAYGGDLRPGGFTELLFEIVNRYRLNSDSDKILVKSYLAWPVHAVMSSDDIKRMRSGLEGLASIVLLSADGAELKLEDRPSESLPVADAEWAPALTAMREKMASQVQARVALGGQTAKYKGRLPGIAEEALIQLKRGKPLYLLGGFGGCSADLAMKMGLSSSTVQFGSSSWPGLEEFEKFGASDLRNGLTVEENGRLAETVHVDEAAALILRGLLKASKARSRKT
ncbi:hypothetical protein [Bradyrhizobium sp. th.b2]|uniref:hypothetical protein n=1 Tax=Bradyrhizobium sp. th-b2 TaxID=172088 RepID=UPI000560340F|nr:hypothetical protein [Bradyrhizobium sp. th.b2]